MEFSSVNPYQSLEVIIADSPQELVSVLKKIVTPVKIHFIVPYGNRVTAYISGDVRLKKNKKG